MMHEFQLPAGGGHYLILRLKAEDLIGARDSIEAAVSLLERGRLPGETAARPVDKNEIRSFLQTARDRVEDSISMSHEYQEGSISWVHRLDLGDIDKPHTVNQIVERHEFYRDCLERALEVLERTLDDLARAVEG